MKELLKKLVQNELTEEEKSEAQKKTEDRAEKYINFFKKPFEKLKSEDRNKLAIAYKVMAGFFVNSDKLVYTRDKLSFKDRLKEIKDLRQKAAFICTTSAKIIGKTALGSLQFVIRNSIKQPAMLAFRLGAGTYNLGKYLKAKISGNKRRMDAESANFKYQMQETRNAVIGTGVTAAIIISTLGTAGITASFFGAASAAIATTASAIDTAALANDTAQGTFKQIKGRAPKDQDIHQQGIELNPIRRLQETLNNKDRNPAPCSTPLCKSTTGKNLRHH